LRLLFLFLALRLNIKEVVFRVVLDYRISADFTIGAILNQVGLEVQIISREAGEVAINSVFEFFLVCFGPFVSLLPFEFLDVSSKLTFDEPRICFLDGFSLDLVFFEEINQNLLLNVRLNTKEHQNFRQEVEEQVIDI
jgi:hypothetical protein